MSKPPSQSTSHTDTGVAHSHIRCRGLDIVEGLTRQHRGIRNAMLPEKHEDVTNETMLDRVDEKRKLLPMLKSRKLKYFGHISRHTSLEKGIMFGTMPGLRRQGGQRKEW